MQRQKIKDTIYFPVCEYYEGFNCAGQNKESELTITVHKLKDNGIEIQLYLKYGICESCNFYTDSPAITLTTCVPHEAKTWIRKKLPSMAELEAWGFISRAILQMYSLQRRSQPKCQKTKVLD